MTADFFKRQAKPGVPPQINAVNTSQDVIFLTIGGNDLGFGGVVTHCLVKVTRSAKDCGPLLGRAEKMLDGDFKGRNLEADIKRVLTAIKADADPRAKIVLLGYPYLEADSHYVLSDRTRVVLVGRLVRALGLKGDTVAERIVGQLDRTPGARVVFVPTKRLFGGKDLKAHGGILQLNHELHAGGQVASLARWFIQPKILGGDLTTDTDVYYHPNPMGWHEEARLLTRIRAVPKRDLNSGLPPGFPGPVGSGPGDGGTPIPPPPPPPPPPGGQGDPPPPPPDELEVLAISTGANHSCALRRSGHVLCRGANESGQLGTGTTTDSSSPVVVQGLDDATAISAGISHTCALRWSGQVVCWGWNLYGQLGDGTTATRPTREAVDGLTDATAITSNGQRSCAVRQSGQVVCWGRDLTGYAVTPMAVDGLDDATAVSAGTSHMCAVRRSMQVAGLLGGQLDRRAG